MIRTQTTYRLNDPFVAECDGTAREYRFATIYVVSGELNRYRVEVSDGTFVIVAYYGTLSECRKWIEDRFCIKVGETAR